MYTILIKNNTTGCVDKRPTYKAYFEPGETVQFETDDIDVLSDKFTELLNTYQADRIIPCHFLDVEINPQITDCNADATL